MPPKHTDVVHTSFHKAIQALRRRRSDNYHLVEAFAPQPPPVRNLKVTNVGMNQRTAMRMKDMKKKKRQTKPGYVVGSNRATADVSSIKQSTAILLSYAFNTNNKKTPTLTVNIFFKRVPLASAHWASYAKKRHNFYSAQERTLTLFVDANPLLTHTASFW